MALLVQHEAAGPTTLLVVEREGSGPGNERNIIKWWQAVRGPQPILLKARGAECQRRYDRVVVLLAFGRGEKWDKTDFDKTVAYCELLTTLVNQSAAEDHIDFCVTVRSRSDEVVDWRESGYAHGFAMSRELAEPDRS